MPKLDPSRDYYADLGLPPTADDADIKKQFRKLALQYHPDRNPGREAEVNAQFQIIQSAQEILSDPEQKVRYDSSRRTRYPGASGVKGNPWQDVGKNFPTPPQRNAAPNRTSRNPPPPSGAQKYRNFTSGAAPTAKQPPREDPMEDKRNAWQAFEQMRPGSQGRAAASQSKNRQSRPVPPKPTTQPQSASRPVPPKPTTQPQPEPQPQPQPASRPVPRTPAQKQRAEAAFGSRKPTGYAPRSPAPGDEPAVSSSAYSTNRRTFDAAASAPAAQEPIPDPLAQFRDEYGDARQRTPYRGNSGEKTNPFDGIPISRTKSTREGNRHSHHESPTDNLSPGSSKHHSSSDLRSPNHAESNEDRPSSANATPPNAQRQTFASRASAKYTPAGKGPAGSGPSTPKTEPDANGKGASTTTPAGQSTNTNGPSMYGKASSTQSSFLHPKLKTANGNNAQTYSYPYGNGSHVGAHHEPSTHTSSSSPSGDVFSNNSDPLTPYERQQRDLLKELIGNANTPTVRGTKRRLQTQGQHANSATSHSFSIPVDDEMFTNTTHETYTRFARSSVDDINTKFANDQESQAWQFNAGSPHQEDSLKKRRAQSGSRLGRQSPQQAPPPRPPKTKESADPNQVPPPSGAKWDAQGWSEIGAQNFAPQPLQNPSVSPTRQPTRANTKKPKVHPTMGSAGLVNDDDDSSDADVVFTKSRPVNSAPETTASPEAMDIDTPPPALSATTQPKTSARTIPVEPSRPEWRPGNVQGGAPDAAQTNGTKQAETKAKPNLVGSEDSEEFRASFAELRNVAPFNQKATGLKSFDDLKSNLPFESRPSDRIPISKDQKSAPLEFPQVPQAPPAPPALAVPNLKPTTNSWNSFCQDFQAYLALWDAFNCQVIAHFNARKEKMTGLLGPGSQPFLLADDPSDTLQEYLEWIEQDKDVRRKWAAACDEHEKRIKEFLAYRVQMQGSN